jgi:hypothetical protein
MRSVFNSTNEQFSSVRYNNRPMLETHYGKKYNQKLLTQESSPAWPQKTLITHSVNSVLSRHGANINDVSRSEQLIGTHYDSKDSIPSQHNSIF